MSSGLSLTFSALNVEHNIYLTLTKCCEVPNIAMVSFMYHVLADTSKYCTARADIVGKQMCYINM